MSKALCGEVSGRGGAWRSCPLLVALGGGEGEHEARPVGDRSEKFGETAVGNGVIMGVGTCRGTSETTTAGFKVNLSWGGAMYLLALEVHVQ